MVLLLSEVKLRRMVGDGGLKTSIQYSKKNEIKFDNLAASCSQLQFLDAFFTLINWSIVAREIVRRCLC